MTHRPGLRPVLAAAAVLALGAALAPAGAGAATTGGWSAAPTYRVGDYGGGLIRSILPAGENGLVNAADLAAFEATGARPAGSQDQLGPYANLLYAGPGLTDA